MTFKKCDRTGCQGEGKWMPRLIVWASDDPDRLAAPLRINLVFHVCGEHAKVLGVEDFLGGFGYQAIAHLFHEATKKQPGWETAKIEYAIVQNAAMN